MIFTTPTPWAEALEHEEVKRILPNTASTQQLNRLPVELRRRARFSAGVSNARILGRMDELCTRMVSPDTVLDPDTGERRPARPGEYMDKATFRVELTKALRETQYSPDPDKRGTIQDLLSETRQDLIAETNLRMAQGYGYWAQGQQEGILYQWPAQELYRAESRDEPRTGAGTARESSYWGAEWVRNGGTLYEGRMIALKNDGIWRRVNYFGVPYAPFHFNSGMDVRDVDRDTAIRLGVMEPDTVVEPEERPLNEDLSASVEDVPASLVSAVMRVFEDMVSVESGRLTLQP